MQPRSHSLTNTPTPARHDSSSQATTTTVTTTRFCTCHQSKPLDLQWLLVTLACCDRQFAWTTTTMTTSAAGELARHSRVVLSTVLGLGAQEQPARDPWRWTEIVRLQCY